MTTKNSSASDDRFCGVIIAAGRGSRMNGLSSWIPKTLLPVDGHPVLAYQISLLRSIGIHRIFVVVGYLKEMVIDYLETVDWPGAEIEPVEQEEQRGIGHALQMLEAKIDIPFVVFLGDIFIIPADFACLVSPIKKRECDAVLAVAYEKDPVRTRKNFSVITDEDGWVTKVIEKPETDRPEIKGCGVYAFTTEIFDSLKDTPLNEKGELGITEAIQTFIDRGLRVRTALASRWDINLTTPDDLAQCDQHLLSFRKSAGKTA